MSTSDILPADMNAATALANLPDLKQYKSALPRVVESREHILLISPKFHLEVAGVGIEYFWGKSKQTCRRETSDEIPGNLHSNIVRSLCGKAVLRLGRICCFERRTRDSYRAFFTLDNQGMINSKDTIERMQKISKAYCNIIDIEPAFIDRQ